jgi:hypothetical protein
LETEEIGRKTAENFFRFFNLKQPEQPSLDDSADRPA